MENRRLIVHAKVGDAPVGYRCSKCQRVFPVPGGDMSDEQKSARVKAEFDKHNCKEDANQAAARVVRESTEKD